MTKCLPRPPRAIHAVETARDLIEIHLRLLVSAGEDAFEIELIGRMFVGLLRAAHGQINEVARHSIGILIEPVKRSFAFAARPQQPGVLQQTQMGGDARLPHARDFLQFVYRQFVLLQQGHDAQAGGIGQGPEGLERGCHSRFCKIPIDALVSLYIIPS